MQSDVVLVNASGPIVQSTVFLGSCASYLSLPTAALGYFYQVITWENSPRGGTSYIQVMTVSPTTVIIRLPIDRGPCVVNYLYIKFYCGDAITLSMTASQLALLTSDADLSGTM